MSPFSIYELYYSLHVPLSKAKLAKCDAVKLQDQMNNVTYLHLLTTFCMAFFQN